MVYVHAKLSQLNKHIGKKLSPEEIKDTLIDLGMDVKGETILEDKDTELKVEITAEKADMVSVLGIGRAIKYYRGYETKLPSYELKKGRNKVIVKKSTEKVRPRTVCVIMRGIEMTQELLDEMIEIQEKIHDSFGRNRKKVSIGIYPCDDFDFPVTFTAEKPEDIVFRPLEMDKELNAHEILVQHETGKKFAHHLKEYELYPVFRDAKGKVLSMPPIINSHETGRVDMHHKDLFIECSGHNLAYLDAMLKVLVTSFIELGAKAESVQVEYENGESYGLDLSSTEDKLSLSYVNKLIGVEIKAHEVESYLNKMMYGLKNIQGEEMEVLVPAFRTDVWDDADIADDIARAYGYNNILPKLPNVNSIGGELEFSQFRRKINEVLIGSGFLELYTYILTSTEDQFTKMNKEESEHITLIDSADQGTNMTRLSILPELLKSLHINRKHSYPQKVFENGFTIQPDRKEETGARNEAHLALAIADPKSNYTQIKGMLDFLFKTLELEFKIQEEKLSEYIEGRCASVYIGEEKIGELGELHPQVLENFGLLVPVSSLELNLEKIFEIKNQELFHFS